MRWPAQDPAWEFCWVPPPDTLADTADGSGISLRDVYFRGRKVLARADLPVLNVKYDPGGCGGPTLSYRDWMHELVRFDADNVIRPGYAEPTSPPRTVCDDPGQDVGSFLGVAAEILADRLILTSQLQAGWYRYIHTWTFQLDGTLEPRIKLTAVANACTPLDHDHHAYWRFDFDIDGEESDAVEESNDGSWSPLGVEAERYKNPSAQRRWRVRDTATNASYELVPGSGDGLADSWAVADVWALRYADGELDDGGATSGPLANAAHMSDYVDGAPIGGEDVVLWYHAGSRHTEDEECDAVGPTLLASGFGATLDPVPGGAITAGSRATLTGTGFSPGSVIKLFVNTGSGVEDVSGSGGFVPAAITATSITWDVPPSVPLGQGFGSLFVVNTDQAFATSNTRYALLYGDPEDNLPTINSIGGSPLATSLEPGVPLAHADTVVTPGSTLGIGGTGFNSPGVNLFAAAAGGPDPAPSASPCAVANYGPVFPDGNATSLSFAVPAGVPAGPANFQAVNSPYTGNVQSNAVSAVAGAQVAITSVSLSGSTVTILGQGFSCLSTINLFNLQGSTVVNLGGTSGSGQRVIPLQFVSSTELRFTRPATAQAGPAFVQVLNPPFIPFSSSGNDPDGAFSFP
jgi:hypothetical protein